LLGMDMASMLTVSSESENNVVKEQQVKHLFFERRDMQGAEENEMAITFKGQRMGMASFLADSGSGGAAEYIPSDVIFASYVSTREPRQIYEEMMALISRSSPNALADTAKAESSLGFSFANDLAASLGTEAAFGLENLTLTGPVWIMAGMVNDPATLESTIKKIVDGMNAQLANAGKTERITLTQETVDGRSWTTLQPAAVPVGITWTYDRGYIVAASDRGAALRALATRNGGSPLVYSSALQQQLPAAAGLHPSGFAWLNTKGALKNFASMITNPTVRDLISERDPILVAFSATTEQIRAASRTRISGLIMDIMLLQGISQLGKVQQTAAF